MEAGMKLFAIRFALLAACTGFGAFAEPGDHLHGGAPDINASGQPVYSNGDYPRSPFPNLPPPFLRPFRSGAPQFFGPGLASGAPDIGPGPHNYARRPDTVDLRIDGKMQAVLTRYLMDPKAQPGDSVALNEAGESVYAGTPGAKYLVDARDDGSTLTVINEKGDLTTHPASWFIRHGKLTPGALVRLKDETPGWPESLVNG